MSEEAKSPETTPQKVKSPQQAGKPKKKGKGSKKKTAEGATQPASA